MYLLIYISLNMVSTAMAAMVDVVRVVRISMAFTMCLQLGCLWYLVNYLCTYGIYVFMYLLTCYLLMCI